MDNNTTDQSQVLTQLSNWGIPRVNALAHEYNKAAESRQWADLDLARDHMENEIRSQLRAIGRYIAEIAQPMASQGGDHDFDGVISYVWDGIHEHLGHEPRICVLRSVIYGQQECPISGTSIRGRATKNGYVRKQVSTSKRLMVYKRDGYKCVSCGTSDDLSIDHIHPVSLGGSNDTENLQTMCMPCNIRKGAKVVGSNE